MNDREVQIREQCVRGETHEAFTGLIRLYGPEIFGFLVAIVRNESDADDIFAQVCEKIWLKLPGFRWECSLRTWCYVVARRKLQDFARGESRVAKRKVALSEAPAIPVMSRTSTRPYLRTDRRREFERIRSLLSPADHALLILRVDRQLSWKDLATTFADRALTADELEREAARLRQRYRTLRLRLTEALREKVHDGGREQN